MNELRDVRKQMFAQMEQKLHESWSSEADSLFFYHPSEDRIVLSHALFWVMSQNLKGKIRQEKYLLLLRQYQEEMLDAYLQDTEDYPMMLHYCNIIYEYLPMILTATHDLRTEKDARKLAAISVVAAGYGGDMDEELANELLDDMGFFNNKVKCRKIELMLPKLMKMVEGEMERFSQRGSR
ncbi:MAG: hypothetical protein E7074_04040 [Bacteroidales bacterium]|nr:hypothetical protein [Bacteroidales bacterium]